jgi:hypothetical protein
VVRRLEPPARGRGPGARVRSRPQSYKPWYAERFKAIEEVAEHWRAEYRGLRERSARFSESFYDSTLPPEVIEASRPTSRSSSRRPCCARPTGGSGPGKAATTTKGCCHGSCTHVWNYAQALPHLFPALERGPARDRVQRVAGRARHQTFRAALPIRPTAHSFHAAADGQLGGVLKVYREWRISGDEGWLRKLWPRVSEQASTTASRPGTRATAA